MPMCPQPIGQILSCTDAPISGLAPSALHGKGPLPAYLGLFPPTTPTPDSCHRLLLPPISKEHLRETIFAGGELWATFLLLEWRQFGVPIARRDQILPWCRDDWLTPLLRHSMSTSTFSVVVLPPCSCGPHFPSLTRSVGDCRRLYPPRQIVLQSIRNLQKMAPPQWWLATLGPAFSCSDSAPPKLRTYLCPLH